MKKLEIESIDKLLLSHLLTTEPFPPQLHIHNNAYELTMFKSGNVDYFINNITYHLTPGDLLLICPNDIHVNGFRSILTRHLSRPSQHRTPIS